MRWDKLFTVMLVCSLASFLQAEAQSSRYEPGDLPVQRHFLNQAAGSGYSDMLQVQDTTNRVRETFPSPRSVMFKSLMVPGWGQIENRQAWKVPIVYGLFAGVGYYTYYLNGQYQDYRAAFYNSFPENTDQRFGPTPVRLQGVNRSQLQSNRNSLRNRRDFMAVVFLLAYGLNAVDAYVFAHMRSFDVSDDLTARTILSPDLLVDGSPGITLSISLSKR